MADDLYRNLRFGPFELSSRERVLRRDGVMLPLGGRAFDILIYLAERPGEVIAKQELLDRVWSGVTVEEGSIRVHVFAIRKALGDGQFGNRYIANIETRLLVRRHHRPSRRQCGEHEGSSTRSGGIMTTAPNHIDDTRSPTDLQQFVHPASNLFELLQTAKRERDREAAKALLVTASSILQSEIERRSRTKGVRPGVLAGWQIARVRFGENLRRTIHAKDLSAAAQRSTSHFSRSFKQAFGEPPHAYPVRRRLERVCHLMIISSTSLGEIALRASAFMIKHIWAGS
jgi:AraC-like DNA-binding protein